MQVSIKDNWRDRLPTPENEQRNAPAKQTEATGGRAGTLTSRSNQVHRRRTGGPGAEQQFSKVRLANPEVG